MVHQWFSGNSGENRGEKREIPLKVFPFFRKIFSGKACSIWFPTGKTDFSIQMESALAQLEIKDTINEVKHECL